MSSRIEFQKRITDFIFIEDEPQKADIIFVPGNGYPQMSEQAAQLWKEGYAPYILPSGKYSVVAGHFVGPLDKKDIYQGNYETEWEFMADVLMKNGVSAEAILKEDQATFTYENAIYSRQVTDRKHLEIKKAIICCKNYHARRCSLYYQLLYPDTAFCICSSDVDGVAAQNWHATEQGIDCVMGEVTRIMKQFNLMLGDV